MNFILGWSFVFCEGWNLHRRWVLGLNAFVIMRGLLASTHVSRSEKPDMLSKRYYFVNSKNSSFVNPASEMISRSNPRFISPCFGTDTTMSSFTRIMWLPFCRATRKPSPARALTTSRQESRGSFDNYFSLFALDTST